MPSDRAEEYLLPPLTDLIDRNPTRPLSSWSPFATTSFPDRGYSVQYEAAPSHDSPDSVVGLGISDDQFLDEQQASRSRHAAPSESQTTLLDHSPHGVKCPTKHTIVQRRLSWVPLTILVLAIYSTILSGIYMVVAFVKPRYGNAIGSDGHLAPSTASLLSALFAKTIELAYVTVCVAFLGQVLSRRAITKGSRGISISDMSMRSWIMQPGSLIVHWETLRYSAWTFLGLLTLTATLVGMLYTTAAEALVSPKLVMGPREAKMLVGDVFAQFANPAYAGWRCATPIQNETDPIYRNSTCLELEHVGQAYHNYQVYLNTWSLIASGQRPGSSMLDSRPLPVGSLHDNITVTGAWIDQGNMTALSQRYGRMVNNITAAMPHGGILAAAVNPANGIRQPQSVSGEGVYEIDASLPSPAVNVLCVGMTGEELAPLIYDEWPDTHDFDPVTWSSKPPPDIPVFPSYLNRTVVDGIFGFGEKYGQRPPIFGKLPLPYNTILNTSTLAPSNAMYLLGATPEGTDPPYVLCALKAKQSPRCSTQYVSGANGAQMAAICNQPTNGLQYDRRVPEVLDGIWQADWKNIASLWATSLSLGTGITDGQASNSRLLMQLVPTSFSLDPLLPSVAEAFAVLAGSTLIMSSLYAPFAPFWNYTAPQLERPIQQSCNSTVRAMGYASGGTEEWQDLFHVILVFAFITSAICLAFMLFEVKGRQVTDFTEPQNLFALAMNSPATARLEGACGAGPAGRQLKERWYVGMEEEDEHYYIRTKAEESTPRTSSAVRPSPVSIDVEEPSKSATPAMDEYRRLSNRSSLMSRFY
ncbi:hypothetical protein FE257_009095 [Aspergillus nanangensis]|uniref:Uncharacterized protein n=1 Tax=Aspergillus nanangensis TaxID=2582783 RepID=A0AAD4CYM4_ASPNN|nr:hypothetical protein FE257_009095 [Aspergillus nanangensis]